MFDVTDAGKDDIVTVKSSVEIAHGILGFNMIFKRVSFGQLCFKFYFTRSCVVHLGLFFDLCSHCSGLFFCCGGVSWSVSYCLIFSGDEWACEERQAHCQLQGA